MLRWIAVTVLLAGLLGCSVNVSTNSSDNPVVGTATDTTTWDLREPPTRADVGMRDEERVAIYRTDEPHDVTVLLPQDRALEVPATLVTFDALLGDPADPAPEPTGMDISTDRTDLDTLSEQYAQSLDELGLPPDRLQGFRSDVAAAEPESISTVRSPYAAAKVGSVRVVVQARYVPADGTGTVSYILSWT